MKNVLSKNSNSEEIRKYFSAILELAKSDEKFPVNLNEVWMLVYGRRDFAIKGLKENFIENEDFIIFLQKEEKSKRGRPTTTYMLSVSCLEYFIARKNRSVFDIYRQVFHKTNDLIQNKQLTAAEMILQIAQNAVNQERRINNVEERQSELENEVKELKIKTKTDSDYTAIVGYASRLHINVDIRQACKLGQAASRICRLNGFETGQIKDPRFGYVKIYPDNVLNEVFKKFYPNSFK